jgi:hypothetical protein
MCTDGAEVHSAGVHDVIMHDVDVWSSGVHMQCGRVLRVVVPAVGVY